MCLFKIQLLFLIQNSQISFDNLLDCFEKFPPMLFSCIAVTFNLNVLRFIPLPIVTFRCKRTRFLVWCPFFPPTTCWPSVVPYPNSLTSAVMVISTLRQLSFLMVLECSVPTILVPVVPQYSVSEAYH